MVLLLHPTKVGAQHAVPWINPAQSWSTLLILDRLYPAFLAIAVAQAIANRLTNA
ncbi:hypothetical protein HW132_32250 [Brasilonema sp. CT11]|nr:hypothetical protein [Brasilonema sp. CT11]